MTYSIFIIPLLMILTGYLMYKHPPKKINKLVGYRTSSSMKNSENWQIANQSCGKLWIKFGAIILIINILLFVLDCFNILKFTEDVIGIIILLEIIPMVLSIFIVEKKISKYEK